MVDYVDIDHGQDGERELRSDVMKILLPIDDSSAAGFALERVVSEDWPADSEFKIVTVVEPLEQILPGPDPAYTPHGKIVRPDLLDAAARLVSEAAARLIERFRHQSVRFEVLEGHPADRIVTVAAEWPADLIVIASHGRRGLSRLVMGSVAEAVVLRAPCSAEVVLPSGARRNERGEPSNTNNVLIAVDTSNFSSHVLKTVLERKWPESSSFRVMTVLKPLYAADFGKSGLAALQQLEDVEQAEKVATRVVNETARELRIAFRNARVSAELMKGEVKKTILTEARRWPADLIVVGSQGRRGLALCALGSISLGVLEGAPCSVLVVRPAKERPAGSGRASKVQEQESFGIDANES